jgi:hypothetical protein
MEIMILGATLRQFLEEIIFEKEDSRGDSTTASAVGPVHPGKTMP